MKEKKVIELRELTIEKIGSNILDLPVVFKGTPADAAAFAYDAGYDFVRDQNVAGYVWHNFNTDTTLLPT